MKKPKMEENKKIRKMRIKRNFVEIQIKTKKHRADKRQ